jgi:tetratricopeptide (TPR) repeat protein
MRSNLCFAVILCLPVAALVLATQLSATTPAANTTEPPNFAEWQKCVAEGDALYQAGKFAEATRVLEKAVHYAEHFPDRDPRLPVTIHGLAYADQERGDYPEAISLYLRAIRLWERIGPSQHTALLRSTDNLIGAYVEAQDYRAAKKLLAARLPEMERSATTWRDRATLLNTQSSRAYMERDYAAMERLLRQAVALWDEHPAEEGGNKAIVLTNLAHVLALTKRYPEALDVALRASGLSEKPGSAPGSLAVRTLDYAGSLAAKLRRPAESEQYYLRALSAAEETFGPDSAVYGAIMLHYSGVLRALQRPLEAKLTARAAKAVLQRSGQSAVVDVLGLTAVQ